MERTIILASHGNFASGIQSSLELICGGNHKIETLDCYLTEDFDLAIQVKTLLEKHKENEVVVVTDIFGGSVNNEFLSYIERPNFYLVAGLNLPFLIELVTQLEASQQLSTTIQQALENSKQMIQFCNDSIQREMEEEDF